MRRGAHVDTKVGTKETTALAVAVRSRQSRVVAQLLRLGADPNARYVKHSTPLHKAASYGYKGIVKALLEGGADVNATQSSGTTPLHRVSKRGRADVVVEWRMVQRWMQ